MNRVRRMLVSFCVLLNLVGFGLIILVLTNAGELGDAILMFAIALFGLCFNLLLAFALWRGGLRTRRLESELRRAKSGQA